MFGPPSSPPQHQPTTRRANRSEQTEGGLLPAFGGDSAEGMAPREFMKPKFAVYRDPSASLARADTFLPTPLPTSEANAPVSSPPPSSPQQSYSVKKSNVQQDQDNSLDKPQSSIALKPMLIVRVPLSGEEVTVGRSSKSSMFALSPSNRLASRVHAKISFNAETNFVAIECLGWNGLTVTVPQEAPDHEIKNEVYPVSRGQKLNVERVDGILMNIQGDKSLIELVNDTHASDQTEDEAWEKSSPGPARKKSKTAFSATDIQALTEALDKHVSRSAESTPAPEEQQQPAETDPAIKHAQSPHQLAEESLDKEKEAESAPIKHDDSIGEKESSHVLKAAAETISVDNRAELRPSRPNSPEPLPMNKLGAAFQEVADATTSRQGSHQPEESPALSRQSSEEPDRALSGRKSKRPYETISDETRRELENVAANFIAFSRLSTVPLAQVRKASSALQALPKSQVRDLIRSISSVGVVEANNEDATGRQVDDEYYYIPEKDDDENRRSVVHKTRGHRSLRSCRKTHKQYYYRPLNID